MSGIGYSTILESKALQATLQAAHLCSQSSIQMLIIQSWWSRQPTCQTQKDSLCLHRNLLLTCWSCIGAKRARKPAEQPPRLGGVMTDPARAVPEIMQQQQLLRQRTNSNPSNSMPPPSHYPRMVPQHSDPPQLQPPVSPSQGMPSGEHNLSHHLKSCLQVSITCLTISSPAFR